MSRNPKTLAQGRDQVDTPAFKAWFGDSKVVDGQGNPLVVFHGTTGEFSEFSLSDGLGFHFGEVGQANLFSQSEGGRVLAVYLSAKKLLRTKDFRGWIPEVVAWDLRGKGIFSDEDVDAVESLLTDDYAARSKIRELLSGKGYDGITYANRYESSGRAFVVFNSTQIKSAIGNRGTFDPINPDIRFSHKMHDFNTKPSASSGHALNVATLQKQLADVEAKYEVLRIQKKQRTPEWDAIAKEAAPIRVQLFELTGDYYGRPRAKLVKPGDDDLLAEYETPGDVPQHVMNWLLRSNQILTSDATDAVRWSRIVGTKNDERFPAGDLTLYRAVVGDEIRPGDWVTTDLGYAQEHLRRYLGRDGQVLQLDVDGRDVLVSPTGNYEEAIYAPREFSGAYRPNEAQESVVRERER